MADDSKDNEHAQVLEDSFPNQIIRFFQHDGP
jgi:hypothetical protein